MNAVVVFVRRVGSYEIKGAENIIIIRRYLLLPSRSSRDLDSGEFGAKRRGIIFLSKCFARQSTL
jgi:hypothetical protein